MTLCSSKAETHLAGAWFSFADAPEGAIYRHGGVSVGEIVGVEEVGEMDGEAVGGWALVRATKEYASNNKHRIIFYSLIGIVSDC